MRRRLLAIAFFGLVFLGLGAGSTLAAEPDRDGATTGDVTVVAPDGLTGDPATDLETIGDAVGHNQISLNMMWLVVSGVLVVFMQAGFALVETGFTQAKNAAHTVTMNFLIFALGAFGFLIVGYSFMFGNATAPAIGLTEPFGAALVSIGDWQLLSGGGWAITGAAYAVAPLGFLIFQLAFMDTVATIPTGAMAERWKFKSFIWWGIFCGAVFYPLYGNWVWGGGWLAQLGVLADLGHGAVDFAGSGVVHAMGGAAALAGALVLGPRRGKYGVDGRPRTIPGHHIPMALLGTFILLVGWFGFNAGSTFAATDLRFTVVAANTLIAAVFGSLTAALTVWVPEGGKPDPGMLANGMLAGLVGITAPCAFVAPWAAMLIGGVAGCLVVFAIRLVERRGVDDPVGAIAVHGVNGTFGVLAVGLFADGTYGVGWNGVDGAVKGLFYGDVGQLVAQAISAAVVWTVMFGLAFAFFKAQNALTRGGIRTSAEDEEAGLDLPEMGVLAYPSFALPEVVELAAAERILDPVGD